LIVLCFLPFYISKLQISDKKPDAQLLCIFAIGLITIQFLSMTQKSYFLILKANLIWFILLLVCLLASCDQVYSPKPRGYPRIDLPEAEYQMFLLDSPYYFEHSKFAEVSKDTTRMSEPYWFDIIYKKYGATVQLTYKPITDNKQKLNELVEDSRTLISKHQIKASAIEEQIITTASGDKAFVFKLSGQVPTQFQFYTTDSTHHFLRGAMYFNTATANDSLAPVINYVSKDIIHLLQTLKWKKVK